MIQDYLEKIKQQLGVMCLYAVIYVRYSSDNQRGESIDAQVRLIKEWAKAHNIIIVATYADEAQSAKRDDRKQFQQMIADAKTQKDWQLVLVHKLDRFARNRFDSAAYRVELRKNKKFLISTTEQFDDSPESSMMEGIIEAMAEFYSKNLAREVMKGLTENALNAKFCGGIPPLGYDIQNSSYVINDFEAQAVKLIFSLFLDGKGYNEIMLALNCGGFKTKRNAMFTKNSLYEILRNERYTGTFIYNKTAERDPFTGSRSRHRYKRDDEVIRVENAIPSIISLEDFRKVQKILNSRKRAYSNNAKEIYLLTGKIQCGHCGGSYVGTRKFNSQSKKYVTYQCNIKQRSANQRCSNSCISRDWLEEHVLNAIDEYVMQFDDDKIHSIYRVYADSVNACNKSEIYTLHKEIANIDRELARIADVITITSSPTLIEKLTNLEQQKTNILARVKKLSRIKNNALSEREIKSLLSKAKEMLKGKSVPHLRELIDLIVKKIVINENAVIVYLNFSNNKVLEKQLHIQK